MNEEGYLLDTCICIFLFRGKYDIESQLNKIGYEHCFISDVTVAELYYGAYKSEHVQENLALINHFCELVTIIPFADGIEVYAQEKNRLRQQGKLIEDFDLLIASAAKSANLTLVTDNTKHFQNIQDLKIENWVTR